jgi:hypothetical protein
MADNRGLTKCFYMVSTSVAIIHESVTKERPAKFPPPPLNIIIDPLASKVFKVLMKLCKGRSGAMRNDGVGTMLMFVKSKFVVSNKENIWLQKA